MDGVRDRPGNSLSLASGRKQASGATPKLPRVVFGLVLQCVGKGLPGEYREGQPMRKRSLATVVVAVAALLGGCGDSQELSTYGYAPNRSGGAGIFVPAPLPTQDNPTGDVPVAPNSPAPGSPAEEPLVPPSSTPSTPSGTAGGSGPSSGGGTGAPNSEPPAGLPSRLDRAIAAIIDACVPATFLSLDPFVPDRTPSQLQALDPQRVSHTDEHPGGHGSFPIVSGLVQSGDGNVIAFTVNSKNLAYGSATRSFFPPFYSDDYLYIRSRVDGTTRQIDRDARPLNYEVFVRDLGTGECCRMTLTHDGSVANGDSSLGLATSISTQGRYVAFSSQASNLVVNDTNGFQDVFLVDRAVGKRIISSPPAGGQADGASEVGGISGDGRFVVFSSTATNLVADDRNGLSDVFVYDQLENKLALVSSNAAGQQGNGPSHEPCISRDGRYIAFSTRASNLVAGDDNMVADIIRVRNPLSL